MGQVAIIHFTNYPKGQNRACMLAVMRYTMQEKKTVWKGRQLVSGVNCRPESVYDDFLRTKLLYHKDGGVMFFHMVQSFPAGEAVDPLTAHSAALKLAEWFEGREVLVCTHTDRDHIHSHFLINSVSLEDGKKLHISEPELNELRQRNDLVCAEFSLPVFQAQEKKQVKSVSNAEYHSAARGESWKFRLMNTIDTCMRYARSREEFIALMRGEGYDVRWQDSRKNITYTMPTGMKCRDDRLHDEKYRKENIEREFKLRQSLIHGDAEAPQRSVAAAGDPSHGGGVERPAGDPQRTVPDDGGGARPRDAENHRPGLLQDDRADDGADERGRAYPHDARTGWEEERAALYFVQDTQTPSARPGRPGVVLSVVGAGGLGTDLLRLARSLEQSHSAVPVTDSTTMHYHADRKTLRKEKEKKTILGQKGNDHEKEQMWQQTM